MKKTSLFLLAICCSSMSLLSQENNTVPKKQTQTGFGAIDYFSIKMPIDENGNPEINMGMTGVHYNLWLNKSIYTGLGFYGTVNGKRGGLFTLGLNFGYKYHFTKKLFTDIGFHLGAGGGAGAPDGGGAFLLPHINIGYQFKNLSTSVGISHINFFDKGNINSKQIRLGIQIPLSFDYLSFKEREKVYSIDQLNQSEWNKKSIKNSFLLHLNNYAIQGKSKNTRGDIYPSNTVIRVAGFEIASYLKNNWLIFFKADGAFHGIDAGYMDIFIGCGYNISFNKNRTNILTKFSLGAGGGGGVDTKGGFLIQPDISLEQKLFNNTYLYLNKGYILTPDSHYISSTYGIGIKQYIHNQGIKDKQNRSFSNSKIKGIELIVGGEIYTTAQRLIYPTQQLHQFAFQGNIFITKNLFLAGYTSFASFGNAGAYAEGLVGVGYQTKSIINNKVQFFSQIIAGAAGGGHISTGQGLIIKPSIGINYKLNDKLKLRALLGKVKASGGTLNSTSLNIGLNYNLSFLTAN